MSQDRYVICMKWGELYDSTYVNILYNAVKEFCTYSVKMICLTDDPSGIDSAVECRAIPDVGIPQEKWYHGAWPKLTIFSDVLDDLEGRVLFIDLDMIIVDSIDPFFERDGGIVMIDGGDNWKFVSDQYEVYPSSGIFAFDGGTQKQMYNTFISDQKAAYANFDLEQDFIGAHSEDVRFWPIDWITSFKRHHRRPLVLDFFLPPKKPLPPVKIVAFHGDPRPADLLKSRWYKFPRTVKGPVPWVKDYWDKFSD